MMVVAHQGTRPSARRFCTEKSSSTAALRVEPLEARTFLSATHYSGPITITHGGTYTGNWQSLDAGVPAVEIATDEPVVILNSKIRSRAACIDAAGSSVNLTVKNTFGYGLNPNVADAYPGRFLDIDGFVNLVAEHNYMEGTSGIYVTNYEGNHTARQSVKVRTNVCKNVDGRASDGNGGWQNIASDPDQYKQFFQINKVFNLVGGEVAWNQVVNEPGKSRVEESINISTTTGTAKSPLLIHDNYIEGAFPANPVDAADYTGGGIMASDNGSSYVRVYKNEIVATGAIGIEISSGHDNSIYNNRVLSSGLGANGARLPFSNTAVVIWNFNSEAGFDNNTGHDNVIGWVNGDGERADEFVPDASSWVNNTPLPGRISLRTQAAEFTAWTAKQTRSNLFAGPAGR